MRILLLIAAHGRVQITRICFQGVLRLQADCNWLEIVPWIVTDDPEIIELAQEFGFAVSEQPNLPLGRKFNLGLEAALELEWDYLMQLGSDDLVGSELLELFRPHFTDKEPCWGLTSLYFYDASTGWLLFRKVDRVFGAARFMRRDVVESCGWEFLNPDTGRWIPQALYRSEGAQKRFELWESEINSGLDISSHYRLQACGYEVLKVEAPGLVVDVKSDENIWNFDVQSGCRASIKELSFLPPSELEALSSLRRGGLRGFLEKVFRLIKKRLAFWIPLHVARAKKMLGIKGVILPQNRRKIQKRRETLA